MGEDSEAKKVKITLAPMIDMSESVVHVETTSSYSQVVKDTRAGDIEDSNQPGLPGAQFERNAAANVDKGGEEEKPRITMFKNPVIQDAEEVAEPKKKGKK